MLQAKEISCYRSDKLLFNNLSFLVNSGEIVQIVGDNGAGKTSLLRILAGLLIPQKGEVSWREMPIKKIMPQFYQNIFYLGHENGIKADLTVSENLIFDCRYQRPNTSTINTALAEFQLTTLGSTLCRYLSKGQQQRVALAKLLLTEAILWILDEPFTALDQIGVEKIQALFQKKVNSGGSILISSHQPLAMSSLQLKLLRLQDAEASKGL